MQSVISCCLESPTLIHWSIHANGDEKLWVSSLS